MKKYKAVVTIEKEYEIEIDENVFDENFMKEFRESFYNFHDLEDHVEHIAQYEARLGEAFIEGYGYVLRNGKPPFTLHEVKACNAVNIIEKDEDVEVEVELIKD